MTDDIYVLGLGYNNQKILVEYKDLMIVAAAVYGQSFEKSVLLVCKSHAFVFLDAGQLYGRTEDIVLSNFVVN